MGDPAQPLRLDSTTGADALPRFPELMGLASAPAPHRLILDGEAVVFGPDGRPSFGERQHRMHLTWAAEIARAAARIPVQYVVFDLLWLDDRHLTALPYLERRELLAETVQAVMDGWSRPTTSVVPRTCCWLRKPNASKGSWWRLDARGVERLVVPDGGSSWCLACRPARWQPAGP